VSDETFGFIELIFSFGVVLAILFHQLISVRLQLRKDAKAKERGKT
jgi:hypothetical protein